jgi:hypothetical protein
MFQRDSRLPPDPILDKVLEEFLNPRSVSKDLDSALPSHLQLQSRSLAQAAIPPLS